MLLEDSVTVYQQIKQLMSQLDDMIYVLEDDPSPSTNFELIIENFLLRIALCDGDFDINEMRFLDAIEPQYSFILEQKVKLNNIVDDHTYLSMVKSEYATYIKYLERADSMAGTNLSFTEAVVAAPFKICSWLGIFMIQADGVTDTREIDIYFSTLKEFEKLLSGRGYDLDLDWVEGVFGKKQKPISSQQEEVSVQDRELKAPSTFEDVLEKINQMIGLNNVKSEIGTLANFLKVKQMREAQGLPSPPISLHLVFTGNPGTGKTSVARLVAELYHVMGFLPHNKLVETDRSGLVAGYVGQTAIKTKEVLDSAKGGVLFIDEAYTLVKKEGNDYGQECIDTLLSYMENNREDICIIVAGYPAKMAEFIQSNPGLKSRFNRFVLFEDYNAKELSLIFQKFCFEAGYVLTEEAEDFLHKMMVNMISGKRSSFGNGRDVRNLFEKSLMTQSNRVINLPSPSVDDLSSITLGDISIAYQALTF